MDYYRRWESRAGFSLLLNGTRHFGYYPEGKEDVSFETAQREMENRLGKELNLPKDALILDAGCGEGHVSINLAKNFGYRIEGIDLLENAIQKAEKNIRLHNLSDTIHVHVGDYTTYDWPKHTFDGIFTMETFVHIADYQGSLAHFHDILRPGGILVQHEYSITPPKDLSLGQSKLWNDIINYMGMYGLPHFHHGKFPHMLQDAGFSDVEVTDVTERVLPMFASFHRKGVLPYKLISFFGLQHRFINAMFAVEGYKDIVKNGTWRYNIITSKKKK